MNAKEREELRARRLAGEDVGVGEPQVSTEPILPSEHPDGDVKIGKSLRVPFSVFERVAEAMSGHVIVNYFKNVPALWDLDEHFRVMDEFDDYQQVLSLSNPPIENLGTPEETPA